MKPQTRPFVIVTKRRRTDHAEAESVFTRKSVFRDAAKRVTKEDVQAALGRTRRDTA
jgi:hypothetical protein